MSGYDETKMPKWFREGRKEKNPQRKSQDAEKALAKSLDMSTTPGSGNKAKHPADVCGRGFRIEHKRTDKKSIGVKGEWLDKIKREAILKGQVPAIALQIEKRDEWFLVDRARFQFLVLQLEALNAEREN